MIGAVMSMRVKPEVLPEVKEYLAAGGLDKLTITDGNEIVILLKNHDQEEIEHIIEKILRRFKVLAAVTYL